MIKDPLKRKIFQSSERADFEGKLDDPESLIDIIKSNSASRQTEDTPRQTSLIYKAASPNAYAVEQEAHQTISIKIFEVLFNERLCDLVYLQDLTSALKGRQQDQMFQNLLLTNGVVL